MVNYAKPKKNSSDPPKRTVELFNLESDLGEEKDIASKHRETVEKMLSYLEEASQPKAK